MKRTRISKSEIKLRPWTPEQHRRYIETLGPHLPAILKSLGYFLALPIIALGYLVHGANATPWIVKLLTGLHY